MGLVQKDKLKITTCEVTFKTDNNAGINNITNIAPVICFVICDLPTLAGYINRGLLLSSLNFSCPWISYF